MNGYWAIVALAAVRAAVEAFRIHVERRKITSTRIIEPPQEVEKNGGKGHAAG